MGITDSLPSQISYKVKRYYEWIYEFVISCGRLELKEKKKRHQTENRDDRLQRNALFVSRIISSLCDFRIE